MLLQLFFFSFKTILFSINFVATFVTNFFRSIWLRFSSFFIIILIVILEMIEIVNDLNMNDIDVLLKKYDYTQTKLFWNYFDAHNQNRVQEKILIYVNVFSFNFFISAHFTRVALFFINFRISRISTKKRFKILIVSKIDEFSRDSRDVMYDDDDEKFDVDDDNRSNCIRCYHISIDCRRVASIVCDNCFK
jgi:hypothetical protein